MIAARIILFFLVYGALLAPWPGLDDAYGSWIRTAGNLAYSWGHRGWAVSFQRLAKDASQPFDSRVLLVNTQAELPKGARRALYLKLDTRGIGWVPTAFLTALVVASPVSRRRRLGSLLLGTLAMQAFVVVAVGIHILKFSAGLGSSMVDGLDETFVNQLSPGFFIATLLWIAITFRVAEWSRVSEWARPSLTVAAEP
jgi:hypothetical protein